MDLSILLYLADLICIPSHNKVMSFL